MAQYDLNLRDYWRIFHKRRRIIITITILMTALTYIVTPSATINYQAKTSVKVTRAGNIAGLLLNAIYWDEGSNLITQSRIVSSQPVLIESAKRLNLIPKDIAENEVYNKPEMLNQIRNLKSVVSAEPEPQTNIITITVTTTESGKAVDYVNTIADAFIEVNTNEKNRQIIDSKHFIEEQIDVYKKQLANAENKLRTFKEINIESISLSSNSLADLQQELKAISTQIETIQLQITQLKQRLTQGSKSTIDWISVDKDDVTLQKFNKELIDLQLERERNLIYYTPQSPLIRDLDAKIKSLIENIIFEYQGNLDNLEKRKGKLLLKLSVLPANDIELSRLEREVKVTEEIFHILQQRYQEVLIQDAGKLQEVTSVERATMEVKIEDSKKLSRTIAGFLLGLLIALAAAFIIENLDTSIGSIEDVEEFLNLKVQGVIPAIDIENVKRKILEIVPAPKYSELLDYYANLTTIFAPISPVSEAFYTIRTNLEFSQIESGKKVFLITSSTPDEGKTTALSNIAISMALHGKKVLVVSGDLRKPNLHQFFGVERKPGLTDILLGQNEWNDVVKTFTEFFHGEIDLKILSKIRGIDNIGIVMVGSPSTHPTDLLSTHRLDDFLAEARNFYDIILIDSPPVLPVSDALILASKVEGVILIYKLGVISRNILRRAKIHLENVGSDIWGVILNEVKAEVTPLVGEEKYYRSYKDYYLPEEEGEQISAFSKDDPISKLDKGGLLSTTTNAKNNTALPSEKEAVASIIKKKKMKKKFPIVRKRDIKADDNQSGEYNDLLKVTRKKDKKK